MKKLFDCFSKTNVEVKRTLNTAPNWITMACFPLAGFYLYYGAIGDFKHAFLALGFMALGDMADGGVARLLDQHSRAGKILDWLRDLFICFILPIPILFHTAPFSVLLFLMVYFLEGKIADITMKDRLSSVSGGIKHTFLKAYHIGGFFFLATAFLSINLFSASEMVKTQFGTIVLFFFLINSMTTKWEYEFLSRHTNE